ncbi:MAG: hypothetical protein H7Y59_16470 [Anaerolineales bacterium]|nr:hypothetical protein [Anaerolineales bacterium]
MDALTERRWLALIFSLYFFLAVGYSLLMPIWEAPDEPAHYHIVWYLARKDRFPTLEHNYEMNQPKAFYYLGSWVVRGLDKIDTHLSDYVMPHEYKDNIRTPIRRFDWTSDNYRFLLGVYALRWMNILFGAGALLLNWKAFQLIAPQKPTLRIASLTLAALIPQYLHIMSSVSNDALGTLAGALLFYLTVRMISTRSNLLSFILIPLAIILPLTTKLTVLPVSAALFMIIGWTWFYRMPQKRWLVYSGLAVLFFVGIIYFIFPETIKTALGEVTWRLFSLRKSGITSDYLRLITDQIISTYWGKVGWIAVSLPAFVIILLTSFGLIGIIMNALHLIRTKSQDPQFHTWIATWLIALATIAAVARNGLTTGATQGRFLFPAIGALSILMVSGWHDTLPQRLQDRLPLIIVIFMLACNIGLWLFGVVPVYYQPFLD